MSADTILASIAEASAAQIAQLEHDTAQKIKLVQEKTAATAKQTREQAYQYGLRELPDREALVWQQARLQAGRAFQRARAEMIAAALQAVEGRLEQLRAEDERYRVVYGRLLGEAVTILERENGQVVIRADPRDQALLEELMRQQDISALHVELDLVTWGGMLVSSVDDTIMVDNTLETRLQRARPALQQQIAAELRLPDELNMPPDGI